MLLSSGPTYIQLPSQSTRFYCELSGPFLTCKYSIKSRESLFPSNIYIGSIYNFFYLPSSNVRTFTCLSRNVITSTVFLKSSIPTVVIGYRVAFYIIPISVIAFSTETFMPDI